MTLDDPKINATYCLLVLLSASVMLLCFWSNLSWHLIGIEQMKMKENDNRSLISNVGLFSPCAPPRRSRSVRASSPPTSASASTALASTRAVARRGTAPRASTRGSPSLSSLLLYLSKLAVLIRFTGGRWSCFLTWKEKTSILYYANNEVIEVKSSQKSGTFNSDLDFNFSYWTL